MSTPDIIKNFQRVPSDIAAQAARIAAIKGDDTAAKWLVSALRAAGVLKEGETL